MALLVLVIFALGLIVLSSLMLTDKRAKGF
jgi:hypothetical protein